MALQDFIQNAKTEDERNLALKRFTQQHEIATKLQGTESLPELLSKASEIRNLVEADWVFVWAVEKDIIITYDPGGQEVRVPGEQAGIPGYAARMNQIVNIGDVYDTAELKSINPSLTFNTAADKASGYRTMQVCCVPVTFRDQVLGVMQAINKKEGPFFDELDMESLKDLAQGIAPIMHHVIDLDRQGERLAYQENLNKIVNSIHAARDIDQILISLVKEIVSIFDAERMTIYAVDPESEELFSRMKMADEIREFRVPITSASTAGHAARTRQPVVIEDVYDTEELEGIHPELSFNRSFDEKSGFRTKQVMVVPFEFQGELVGALQLINRTDGESFDSEDLERAKLLSETLGIAFYNQVRSGARKTRYDTLVEKKLIKLSDLKSLRKMAKERSSSIEAVLMDEFNVSKHAILEAYGEFYRTSSFEFDKNMVVPQGLVSKMSDKYDELKFACAVPIEEQSRKVIIAIDDPKDVVKRDHLQNMFLDKRIEFRIGLPEDILRAIDLMFGTGDEFDDDDGDMSDLLSELEDGEPMEEEDLDDEEANEDDSAVVKLVNRIIADAYKRGASDIHIEPSAEGEAMVRYRVDGSCQKVMTFPRAYRNAMLSRIKIMADLDIAERRKPQSGKIKFKKWGKLDIELRVECLPTVGGTEDAVMRILASSKPLPLAKLSLNERNEAEFKKIVETPYGIILVVGPTGSGKTTTLHSALGYINREDRKIWTAEDPVEITQKGLRQVQVNRRAGLDFAAAMRSFLRADPDIIMIGEMRDSETAATGIEASLTGHMVFSTLHTNSAPETVIRLLDMGIDPYSFADALLGVLAQRLVRTLCKECKEEYEVTQEEFDALRDEFQEHEIFDAMGYKVGQKLFRRRDGGCPKCNNIGYKGRMGIHELLVSSDEIKLLIYKRAKGMEIREQSMKDGMRTLKQDGIMKVMGGFTTLEEVRAVCSQ